ncbi:hypothetical protein ACFOOK_17360 [Micromonospora krabiensis]|uniref:Uncharacterized protein n=1 Tax=Micromonospora krabiensis TaxID=307121 RepID=A0A1C3MZL6_9ACTN|nr:hypothetical protein [Micromonospora krabiensis]SBV25786.1 hypothetical protein GA0070620_1266 [Micromonospora krabiensis]
MAGSGGGSWQRASVVGVVLLCTAVRAPDVINEGGWRAWLVVPVVLGVLALTGAQLWSALRGRRGAADPDRARD